MIYRFGLFSFDSATQTLSRQCWPIALEPQPLRALALLLSRPGEIVTRDELRQAIWEPGTHVDFDRGLSYVFSQIRSALQDSASNPRFVQTIPRQGYKFIAPLQAPAPLELSTPAALPLWRRPRVAIVAGAAAAAAGLLSYILLPARPFRLAVSIFDNETGRSELDPWVHSLPDVVVAALADDQPSRLAIIGNAAPLRRPRNIRNLKALARELDADFILLGQLQIQATGLRFVTHLIRLPGETHLKAQRLMGEAGDLASLEAAVVGEFVRAVREHVLGLPAKSIKDQTLTS